MPKKDTKKKFYGKMSPIKLSKIIVVLVFVAVFAGIGVKQLGLGHAAVALPADFYTTDTRFGHTTGSWLPTSVAERLGGVRRFVNVRRWPATLTHIDSYQKGHFLQFGPYVDIVIPGNKTGLHICNYYSAWNVLGYSGWVRVYTDLTDAEDLNFFGTARDPYLYYKDKVTEYPRDRYNTPTLFSHCHNYDFNDLTLGVGGPQTRHKVEFRVRVYDASDQFAVVDLWDTQVSLY